MKYLILDTNVYLHYKDFEQVDWKALIADDVTVCVPIVVLREIDKYKDQGRGKIQKRAKRMSSRFSEIFLQGVAPIVSVEEMDNPPSTAFDGTRFHKDINDDWIILSAIHSSLDPANMVVVSGDNGILLKAKHFGLGFFKMPDEFLVSDELSEDEKEIKKLKEQLAKHETRLPKPLVEFEDLMDRLEIVKPAFVDVQKELDVYETQIKALHPYKTSIRGSAYGQVEAYNRELDEYYEKKIELKRCRLLKQLFDQRFVKIDFWLGNKGTSSLGDTMVFITFPSDVSVYNQDSKKNFRLEDPKDPVLKDNRSSYAFPLLPGKKYENIELWDVDKVLDHQEFKFQSSKLIHNLCERLGRNETLYIDIAECGNFTIDWTVFDSELIEPVYGELHVIVKDP